jgi:hypothetical protein
MENAPDHPPVIRLYKRLFALWRARRFEWLMAALAPAPDARVLDIGGYPGGWGAWRQRVGRIDCLNIEPVGSPVPEGYRFMVGDGCALGFAAQSYDLAYSNSTIEHVGDFERQRAFAAEARRVGRAVWVQTPARECPLEPHVMLPFVHWLPMPWQRRLVVLCSPRRWVFGESPAALERVLAETRLLSRAEMNELFPDCEIATERLWWIIPKSHVAIRRAGDPVR